MSDGPHSYRVAPVRLSDVVKDAEKEKDQPEVSPAPANDEATDTPESDDSDSVTPTIDLDDPALDPSLPTIDLTADKPEDTSAALKDNTVNAAQPLEIEEEAAVPEPTLAPGALVASAPQTSEPADEPAVEPNPPTESAPSDSTVPDTDPPDMWEQASSTPTPIPAPTPVPTNTSDQKPASAAGGNLDALRDRVLHDSFKGDEAPGMSGNATDRARALSQHDLHELQATETLASVQEPTDTSTTHASAVASIASELKQSASDDAVPSAPEGVLSPATPLEDTPPQPGQQKSAAPGTLTESEPAAVHSALPLMRTFRGDVERTVTEDKVSVVKMISDTEKQRHKETDVVKRRTRRRTTVKSYLMVLASFVFIAISIAIGVLITVILTRPDAEPTHGGLFLANDVVEYDATGQSRTALMRGLTTMRDTADAGDGGITEVLIYERLIVGGVDTEQTAPLTATDFLERLDARAPSTFLRSLDDVFVFGIHEYDGNHPFLVLRANYYEGVFAGMLSWEEHLDIDLTPLYGPPVRTEQQNEDRNIATDTSLPTLRDIQADTTSSTSTPEQQAAQTRDTISSIDTRELGTFEDVVIANINARALRDKDDDIVLLWSMPDSSTLIITTNEYTLREVRDQMTSR